MVVFQLLLFLLSSSIVRTYEIQSIIHNADTVKVKCDSLPYRTLYFERACYFAIVLTEEQSMAEARKACRNVLPLSDITKPSADIAQLMFLEISNFLVDDSSVGPNKIALCTTDRPLQCPMGDGFDKAGRRCILRAPKKMTYSDADYFCSSRGTQLPVVGNVLEKTQLLELVRSGPIWLEVTASENGWSKNNEFSWHTNCAIDSLQPPRDRTSFCDSQFAQVLSKDAHMSVSEQSNLMDVVCARESSSEFWIPPERPLTSRRIPPTDRYYSPTTPTTPKQDAECPLGYNGRWSEWTTIGKCPTTCGSCNVAKRKRVCNTTCGCCKGEASDIGPCGIALCPFPTNTCCFKYVKSLNYRANSFFCGSYSPRLYPDGCGPLPDEPRPEPVQSQPVTVETPVKRACCTPGGIWNDWTTIGPCSTSCGSCHNAPRKRTCKSMIDGTGCPCTGVEKDIGPCGIALCPFPTNTCCFSYVKSLNYQENYFFCGLTSVPVDPKNNCLSPITKQTVKTTTTSVWPMKKVEEKRECTDGNGRWGEWSTIGHCATTCGSCSVAKRKRVCNTTCGCCKGLAEDIGPCGIALCPFPSEVGTCCVNYRKAINGNTRKFFCGPGNIIKYPTGCSVNGGG